MPTIVHAPPNEQQADELWAWLSVDHKGEGLVSVVMPTFGNVMLTTMHERMLVTYRPVAIEIAKATKARLRLVRFTRAEIVEEIGGWRRAWRWST